MSNTDHGTVTELLTKTLAIDLESPFITFGNWGHRSNTDPGTVTELVTRTRAIDLESPLITLGGLAAHEPHRPWDCHRITHKDSRH